ncbi:heterokaryon incompatibility protein-domain-containing protein [Leptodontidium sp. MPI-SDFR-AT-0119]|nr:heterokaryon incompatibility protein-domain-containing protein [Leptodontidium sp. MPI-SDFR-AT-0119]
MSDLFSLGDSGQAVQDEAPASTPTTPPSHLLEQDTELQSVSALLIENIAPDSRPSSRSESPGSWSGSGSLSSHSQSRSPLWVPPPPPPRSWTGPSSRSISPDNGNLPPLPPRVWSRLSSCSLGSDIGGIPSPPPPPRNHSWSRSPSPSNYTIPPAPPPTTPPPPHPVDWRPPASAFPNTSPSPRAEPTLEERQQMIEDSTARIMAFLLSNNLANHSSDYAYPLSLFPFFGNINPGPVYSYPSNLPNCLIFVDRIGWLPSDEVSRYLMMGYRVWDNNGRRLHFSGTPIGFDWLKSPIRYPAKEICTQDPRQVPDLHWQFRIGDLSRPTDSEGVLNTMPWDIRLDVPEFSQEGTNLQMVQRAWIRNRFENATPCYFRGDSFAYEEFGGWKVDVSPLKEIRFDDQAEWIDGPYARIGVDMQCLTTVYPSTHVTLKGNNDAQKLCELCTTLDFRDLFEWGLADVEIYFGTTDELLARMECDFCCLLGTLCEDGLDHLRRQDKKADEDDHGFNLTEPIQALLIRDPGHCLSTKPCLVLTQSYHREYLGPIVSLRSVRGEIRGEFSLEDRRFVYFDLLKKMVNTCASTHEECKREKMEEREMILIDVEEMCLVQVKSVQYITLSYVWGGKPIFKTTRENFQSLQIPGALDSVSRLTRDVASVVKYLWIDVLCIIQDDEGHKRVQINRMADIYGNSCLTIVALTGNDSDSPLPGISTPRPQTISVIHGMPFSFHLSGLTQTAHDQRYETRGWTFQERLISRRCLYFCDRQVYLECRKICTSDHEQQFPEQDRGRYSVPLNPLHALHLKDKDKTGSEGEVEKFSLSAMETFISVVCQYTARTLSLPSDIENAFLGIQSFMTRKLGWRFIAGLPDGVFDWALLWVPKGQLKRRSWIDGRGKEVRPPSWSWMGWEGQVSFACYTYLHRVFFLRIRPRIDSFVTRIREERIEVYREPSELWHSDIEVSKDIHDPGPVGNEDPRVERDISFTESPILEFNAEFISAFQPNLYSSRHRSHGHHHQHHHHGHQTQPTPPQQSTFFTHPIEWLTTGDSYGMLRHGLRYNYNASVQEAAETYDAERLVVIAVAGADLQFTVRGGQFGEDKLFEEEGRVVVMLVVRVGGGEGGKEGEEVYERLAIGYLGLETWVGMRPERKVFRLS